ncbi:MAG: hypothetical protein ACLU71_14485 [Blautia hansenii]
MTIKAMRFIPWERLNSCYGGTMENGALLLRCCGTTPEYIKAVAEILK